MPLWLQIIIIAGTLGGLFIAAFAMWIEFKGKQAEIATSTNELEDTVATQQRALEAAERRIQNLEAIVTSEVWDALHDEELPEAERQRMLSQARQELGATDAERSGAERAGRAEELARRLNA